MGLFKRKTCEFCGEKIGSFNRGKKFRDGELCCDCSEELSSNWHDTIRYDLSDAVKHIEERKNNKDILLNEFAPDYYRGFRPTLFVDEKKKLFCITLGGARESYGDVPRYVNENCDLFSFDQLEDTMVSSNDSGIHTLTVLIKNHPWATKLIFKDRIASNYEDMLVVDAELRRILYTEK